MTEESGRDSTDEITQHKLPWRSESEFQVYSVRYTKPKLHKTLTQTYTILGDNPALIFYIHRGKQIHEEAWLQKEQGKKGQLQEKPRVLGTPSTLPMQSGPKWALQQQDESDASVPEEERACPLREEEAMSSESLESFSDW